MSEKTYPNFDSFVGETLNEFHDLTMNGNNSSIIPDFNNSMDGTIKSIRSNVRFFNNRSLLAGAASIVIVLGLAIPALISWQGGSGTGVARKVQTTNDKQATTPEQKEKESVETTTTVKVIPGVDEKNSDTPVESKVKTTTPTTTKKSDTATTTATTAPQNPTAPPTGFSAYTNEKYPGYWKVKFSWTLSSTPGASYCVSDDLSDVQNCIYKPELATNWQNITRDVGDTNLYTYYIVAVSPAGVKSSVVSTTYAIPA